MKLYINALILLSTILLTACGQAGDLYLPTPEQQKTHPHDTFILKDKLSDAEAKQR